MTESRFIQPLDVLFFRGNKLFGDPGSYGEALIPPWPSVAAGALRSRILCDAGVNPADFANGRVTHEALGTPSAPGPFTVTAFHLARRRDADQAEVYFALPADLVVTKDSQDRVTVNAARPVEVDQTLQSSSPFSKLAVLPERTRGKPLSGYWLNEAGWREYVAGGVPSGQHLVKSSALWRFDYRVGVGLDTHRRRAAEGRLFSVQGVALCPGIGFVVSVGGVPSLPESGVIRFGGDGRAAVLSRVTCTIPVADYASLVQSRRCRLVLTTPGIFTEGWLPNGTVVNQQRSADRAVRFELHGVKGWIVAAAMARSETVSGWDLAGNQPKNAQRAVPTGGVYWLELDGDVTTDALRKLAENGLWNNPCEDPQRRSEGFNRVHIAAWRQ